jgi:hypothetical protein
MIWKEAMVACLKVLYNVSQTASDSVEAQTRYLQRKIRAQPSKNEHACNIAMNVGQHEDAWGSADTAQRIHNLSTRQKWVVCFTPRPILPPGKEPLIPIG